MFNNNLLSQQTHPRSSGRKIPGTRRRYSDIGLFIIFGAIVGIRFHPVVNNFWLYDDPYILRNAIEHRPWEYFFAPQVWREMSMRYLTPWVTLSFDLDFRLFGLQPKYFYVHQLVSLWLCAVVLYIVLRLWIKRGFAAVGSLMFLFSAPAAAAAEMLQIRHYVEGLIFCLLSVYFFVESIRKNSTPFSVASALFYLLAMSAKELYVPLVAVLLFLPEGTWRKRIASIIPLAATVVLYFVWRRWMLGDFIAGPGAESALKLYGGNGALQLFLKNVYGTVIMVSGVSKISGWVDPAVAFSLLIFVGLSGFFLVKGKKYGLLIFFFILFLAVYSVPFSAYHPSMITNDFAAYRLTFVVAAYISILLALSSFFLCEKAGSATVESTHVVLKTAIILLTVAVVLLVQWNSSMWIKMQREKTIRPLVEEGRFFMNAGRTSVLDKSDPLYCGTHYYENLEFFRAFYFKEQSPLVVYNGFAYINSADTAFPEGVRVFKYNVEMRGMVDITDSFFAQRHAYLSRLQKLPLSVRLTIDRGMIDLAMGPSHSGHYFLLWGHRPELYSMYYDLGPERKITTRVLFTRLKVYWRFGWESPEGWVTVSPEWLVDFSQRQQIAWEQR